MFGIGTGELLLIALVALLVLGPERMPQLMRDVGKAMNDLRRTSDDLQREFLNADNKIDPTKVLDAATRSNAPETGQAAAIGATMGEEPATQAAVATPAEEAAPAPAAAQPDGESAFDREARLARERIDRMG